MSDDIRTRHCPACLTLTAERANLSRALDTIYGERDEAVAHLRAVLEEVAYEQDDQPFVRAEHFLASLDRDEQDEPEADDEVRSEPFVYSPGEAQMVREMLADPQGLLAEAVPVQQEPEGCDHDWIVETRTASIKVCQSCGVEQAKNAEDLAVGLHTTSSVGLRDRLARAFYDRDVAEVGRESMRDYATDRDVYLGQADCALSVLRSEGLLP